MVTWKSLLVGIAVQAAVLSTSAADIAKTYQVTGPVLEVNERTIVVQKGEERWEIARDAATNIKGQLKVGDKVTIHYRMTAVSVDKKPADKSDQK
jgi:hypothetical protein